MIQGWEIKKLGEVCTIERGGSPRPIQAYITESDDGINWIKIGDATDGSKYITSTKEKIKPEGMKKSRFVHKGDFILSNSMSFGRPYILAVDGCIHDGWLVIHDDSNRFDKNYLYYYLGSPNIYNEFKRLAVGGVVNNLNSELVRSVNVCIPPREEQERIVAELDCLSGVIEKKREQLKELDALAQSIFYQMFGDPITNEKGWEIDRLGNMCDISSSKRIYAHEYCEDGIPFYRGKEITEKSKGNDISVELYIAEDRYNELKHKYGVPQIGDILITAVGTIGNIWVVDNDTPFYFKDGNVLWLQIKDNINPIYFKTLLYNLIDKYKESMANGCAYSALTIVNLKEMQTNKIPFALQQEFADKIEAIEKQKELIKKSISETETLFNARMDYYFN